VARLAGLAEVGEAGLGRGRVIAGRHPVERLRLLLESGELVGEILLALPDFRLGAGLGDVGAGACVEPTLRF
jgi:hypothetical protein